MTSTIWTNVRTCKSPGTFAISHRNLDAGNYKIFFRDVNGVARDAVDVHYKMEVTGASPYSVGVGDDTPVSFFGTGFTGNTKAMLCGDDLAFMGYNEASQPGDNEELILLANQMISLEMDGTADGIQLTINDSKFGSNTSDVEVNIHESTWTVDSVTDTEIVCGTDVFPRDGTAQDPIDTVVTIANGPDKVLLMELKQSNAGTLAYGLNYTPEAVVMTHANHKTVKLLYLTWGISYGQC